MTNLKGFPRTVDFEVFRPELNKAQAYSDGSKGGRPLHGLVTVLCWYVILLGGFSLESERADAAEI